MVKNGSLVPKSLEEAEKMVQQIIGTFKEASR
jgi:hypothetical protein